MIHILPLFVGLTIIVVRPRLTSPVTILLGIYVIQFYLPSVAKAFGYWSPTFSKEADDQAIVVLLVIIALKVFGLLAGEKLGASAGRRLDVTIAERRWLIAVVSFGALLCAFARAVVLATGTFWQEARGHVTVSIEWHAYIRSAEAFGIFAWVAGAGLAVLYGRRGLAVLLCVGGVLTEVSYWALAGRKENALLGLLLPIVFLHLAGILRERVAFIVLAVGAGVAVSIVPLFFVYRQILDTQSDSLLDGIAKFQGATGETFSMVVSDFVEIAFNRLALLDLYVGAWERALLYGGREESSATLFLFSLVPRVIWAGKPLLAEGNDFGWQLGIIRDYDYLTSVSVTVAGDFVLGWSVANALVVVTVYAIVGYLYGASRRRTIVVHKIMYLVVLPPIMYLGGTFALHLAAVVKLAVGMHALWLIVKLAGRRGGTFRPGSIVWERGSMGCEGNQQVSTPDMPTPHLGTRSNAQPHYWRR